MVDYFGTKLVENRFLASRKVLKYSSLYTPKLDCLSVWICKKLTKCSVGAIVKINQFSVIDWVIVQPVTFFHKRGTHQSRTKSNILFIIFVAEYFFSLSILYENYHILFYC